MLSLLWCVCSACPGTPAVFCSVSCSWLTQVGCPLQLAGLLLRLGWRGLAASSSSGPAAYAVFPAAGSLWVFGSPGVCTSASLVTWVGLQPFPSFSWLLLLRLLAGGSWGFEPCVRVLQLRCGLLGLQVGFPCCLFHYLRVGVLLA